MTREEFVKYRDALERNVVDLVVRERGDVQRVVDQIREKAAAESVRSQVAISTLQGRIDTLEALVHALVAGPKAKGR